MSDVILLKIVDGPLLILTQDSSLIGTPPERTYPVMVFEDDGVFKLGSFVEVADPSKPFHFHNIDFICTPQQNLIDEYKSFVNDYLQETE